MKVIIAKIFNFIGNRIKILRRICFDLRDKLVYSVIKNIFYRIDQKYSFEKKKKNNAQRIIWVYWAQGLENAPILVKKCIKTLKEQIKEYDIVVDLDITSPLRTVQDIKNAIDKKASRNDVDVVYSVAPSRRNPYFNMVKEENGFFCKAIASNFTTRQEAPAFYDMNASIYAYSPKALETKEQATFFNSNCDAVVMADTGLLDIDSEEDYELMQVIANYLFEKKEENKEVIELAKCWK